MDRTLGTSTSVRASMWFTVVPSCSCRTMRCQGVLPQCRLGAFPALTHAVHAQSCNGYRPFCQSLRCIGLLVGVAQKCVLQTGSRRRSHECGAHCTRPPLHNDMSVVSGNNNGFSNGNQNGASFNGTPLTDTPASHLRICTCYAWQLRSCCWS